MLGANLYQFGHMLADAAPSTWTMQPSRFGAAPAVDAAGDVQWDLTAEALMPAANAAWIAVAGNAFDATSQDCVAVAHTSATRKRFTHVKNPGGAGPGPMTQTGGVICFGAFGENGPLWGRIAGIGSVTAAGAWLNAGLGQLGTVAGGAGTSTITLPASRGLDPAQCVMLVTRRGATVAANGWGFNCTQTSDTVKVVEQVRLISGGVGVPALVATAYDIVLLASGSGPSPFGAELFAAGSIADTGAAATFAWQGPRMGAVAHTGGAGTGTLTVTLGDPVDAAESVVMLTARRTLAVGGGAAGGLSFGYGRAAANTIEITVLEEAALGVWGAPAGAFAFDIAVFRLGTANVDL